MAPSIQYDPSKDFAGQVESLAWQVDVAIFELPGRATNYWLKDYPTDSCSNVSYIMGHVLAEYGFGDWTWVEGSNEASYGHTWLELREYGAAEPLWSLDSTAHQFAGFERPFLVRGPSPLAETYSNDTKAHRISLLPRCFRLSAYVESLDGVRAILSASAA